MKKNFSKHRFNLKTKLLLLSLCWGITISLSAQQQLPNSGFENWQNVGNNDEEPTHWSSNKTGGGFASLGPQTCFREGTSVFAGSYCVKLETGRVLGNEVNGTVTTGKLEAPNTNPNNGFSQTVRNDPDFSEVFTSRPDSLVGYYKYTSVSGDAGALQVVLHGDADVRIPDPNNTTSSFIIGEAAFNTPASDVSNWTRFAVPFVYNNTDTPSYVLAVFTSSADVSRAERGSTLWVDGVELIYNPPPCPTTTASITLTACEEQPSPSGNFLWTTSGTYTDTIPNVGGCDSVITVNLTIDKLDLMLSQQDDSLWANEMAADSYQWLDCGADFTPIPTATNIGFVPATTGDYAVEMRKGSCLDTSMCLFVQTVSIDDELLKNHVFVHQLQASGKYKITLDFQRVQASYEVVDINGKRLFQGTFTAQDELTLNLIDLSPGIYFLRVSLDDQITTVKLMR